MVTGTREGVGRFPPAIGGLDVTSREGLEGEAVSFLLVAVSCRCSSSWVTVAACAADWLALMQEGVSKRRAC